MSQADRLNRQARVLAAVQENTQAVINSSSNELPGIHAGTIAETLRMDRANVARELNNLYGGSYPAQIWKDTMEVLVEGTANERFETTTELVNGDEKYYPGRDGAEVLSPGYTVQNYRDDHALADRIEALIGQISQETDRGQQEAYYEQALALAEQIYGQTLKGTERRRLEEVYNTYFN